MRDPKTDGKVTSNLMGELLLAYEAYSVKYCKCASAPFVIVLIRV